jgi:hypothetical protein
MTEKNGNNKKETGTTEINIYIKGVASISMYH